MADQGARTDYERFRDINDRQVLEAVTVIGRCRIVHIAGRTDLAGYTIERALGRLEKQGKVSHSGDWWELTAS